MNEREIAREKFTPKKVEIANQWPRRLRLGGVGIVLSIALVAACLPGSQNLEKNYLVECNKKYPEVCLDLKDWERAGSAYLVWQQPPDTVKNNILHRNSLDQLREGIAGIGPNKIIIMKSLGIENVRSYGINSEGKKIEEMTLTLVVNPNLDHYFLVDACKSAGDCMPSEEVLISKQE